MRCMSHIDSTVICSTDAANNDIDGEGGLDAAVVEQLAGSGISTDTLGEDLAAGISDRMHAGAMICVSGNDGWVSRLIHTRIFTKHVTDNCLLQGTSPGQPLRTSCARLAGCVMP